MRLVTFTHGGSKPEAGLVRHNQVFGLGCDMISICSSGKVPDAAGSGQDLASVQLLAPIPRPAKVICVGLNYRDHAAESRSEIPTVPTIFNKFPNVVIGPGAPIVLPRVSRKPDYEAEFTFVIGRGGRHIPAERAMEHVFGYTIINDVSARDFQTATTQWLMGKTFDTFCPMGPWIVTADELDGRNIDVRLWVNGEKRQDANTKDFIFDIPKMIETLSAGITVYPGDVIATGTPVGVGIGFKPPKYLKPGDVVRLEIDGIGVLENRVR